MALEDPGDMFSRLALIARALKAETDRRLAPYGVHTGQQFALECLWKEDGLTPHEMAERIRVEAPTVTRALQRMASAGLIRKAIDRNDRRKVRVWLTPRGEALRETVPQTMTQLQRDTLAMLSDEEQRQFFVLLDRMVESVGRMTNSP
jgi:DNA-binding MarR family transcriptional regulator